MSYAYNLLKWQYNIYLWTNDPLQSGIQIFVLISDHIQSYVVTLKHLLISQPFTTSWHTSVSMSSLVHSMNISILITTTDHHSFLFLSATFQFWPPPIFISATLHSWPPPIFISVSHILVLTTTHSISDHHPFLFLSATFHSWPPPIFISVSHILVLTTTHFISDHHPFLFLWATFHSWPPHIFISVSHISVHRIRHPHHDPHSRSL